MKNKRKYEKKKGEVGERRLHFRDIEEMGDTARQRSPRADKCLEIIRCLSALDTRFGVMTDSEVVHVCAELVFMSTNDYVVHVNNTHSLSQNNKR